MFSKLTKYILRKVCATVHGLWDFALERIRELHSLERIRRFCSLEQIWGFCSGADSGISLSGADLGIALSENRMRLIAQP